MKHLLKFHSYARTCSKTRTCSKIHPFLYYIRKRSCSIFLSSTFSLSLPPPLHFFFCHCVSLCLESFVGIPASDVHTSRVFVRASRLSPFTLPVNVGGNGLWEIKALSCHNERLELHRDLSPMKWEGQYRQRDRLRGEREREKRKKITGAVENEDQRHSSITLVESRHFSPWSQSGERQTATDKCCLRVLFLCLFPSAVVKPTDQDAKTAIQLSQLDRWAEMAITERK